MPFVQRVVEPKYLSRTSLRDENGKPRVTDEELQAVTNCTLSNALRQLASLVLLAEDIFSELTSQLQGITERSKVAQTKIERINEIVEKYDPKKVPVPRYLKTCLGVRTGPRWEKNFQIPMRTIKTSRDNFQPILCNYICKMCYFGQLGDILYAVTLTIRANLTVIVFLLNSNPGKVQEYKKILPLPCTSRYSVFCGSSILAEAQSFFVATFLGKKCSR
ncbi:hypothetical protein ABMA27_000989 [Loxostege sticticalis]|uniref:Wiskott-Aldrich syndrome protein family member n=1 Tax=Loxostege sticticalis TaxID=481309 RepID=A0ABR3I137_LOXSC